MSRTSPSESVRAVLEDEGFIVPPADSSVVPVGTMRWLRATVARFCNGEDHARRRALVEGDLSRIDQGRLRALAAQGVASNEDEEARYVPVAVLAVELGIERDRVADAVVAVGSVAAAYHPGASPEQTARADSAVAALIGLLPSADPEVTANRIGVLVQTCAATAGLIDNAATLLTRGARVSVDELVALTLRDDPPVRSTRRQGPDGEIVELDLAAAGLPFGHGLRPCPGRVHAVALASGVLDVICRPEPQGG